jgi:prepilin-type N-terminal cleavage/methylation domain-containing protein
MRKPSHSTDAPYPRSRPRTAQGVAGTDTRAFAALRARRGGHDRRIGGGLGLRGFRGGRGFRGFSLMEVLIALGIFAIGLVAVAAVFPTAIAIQRETVRDLAGQRAVTSARSTIMALARTKDPFEAPPYDKRFQSLSYRHDILAINRAGTLRDFTTPSPRPNVTGRPGGVQPMIDQSFPALVAPRSFGDFFTLETRGYPQNIPRFDRRDYYWFPLIQARDLSGNKPTWFMYLMVMQRLGTEAVPEVRAAVIDRRNTRDRVIAFDIRSLNNDLDNDGLPDLIQPGDWVLGDDGSIHRVLVAQGTDRITVESPVPPTGLRMIYYAVAIDPAAPGVPKREGRSPIVRIEQFEVVVDQP